MSWNVLLRATAILAAASGMMWSQATDGIVVGRVLDPSGGGVAGVTLRLQNLAMGTAFPATAGADGFFQFRHIPSGRYDLNVTAEGFAAVSLHGIQVQLNQTTTVNVALRLAALATQVSVTDAPAPIDTTTAQIASTSGRREIDGLPAVLAPMGVLNLSLSAAGIASSGGLGVGDGPSVGGQRPRSNSFTIEGAANNRKDVTGNNVAVPNEAVAEVTVLQNQFSAEFGHSSGGQFNVILKSGANQLHGAAYDYLQNRNLNAIDAAVARQGILGNPRYDSNLWGGSAGGPVAPNKLFYSGDFEYNPVGRAAVAGAPVMAPTAVAYRLLASVPGVSGTNLTALQTYLGAASQATGTASVGGMGVPVGVLDLTTPSYQNRYNWLGSADWSISGRDQARGRYVANRAAGIDPETASTLPGFNYGRNTSAWMASLSEFHTFSPRVTNELRLAYDRYDDRIPAGDVRFPGLDTFPTITIEDDLGAEIGPFSQAPQATVINTYQLVDNVVYTATRHTLTAGFDGRKHIAPTNFVSKVRGEYTYSTLERYLFDLNPDVAADRNTGGRPFAGDQRELSGFVSDQYRIRPNLTLTAGLRIESPGMARGLKDQALDAIASVPGLLEFGVPKAPARNFAPRAGVAWAPGRDGSTSIRAGFGLAYNSWFDNLGANSRPPQVQTTASRDIRQSVSGFLAGGGIPANAAVERLGAEDARALTAYYIPTQLTPYAVQWNLAVKRVFRNDYALEARYLGTRGVHLVTQSRIDVQSVVSPSSYLPTYLQAPPQPALDALPWTLPALQKRSFLIPQFAAAGFAGPITSYLPRGNSFYHGLAVELSRRFARGLLFKGAYTWSRNIDDSTADVASTLLSPRRPQDFNDMRAERGTSMLDRRHRFTWNGVWDLPLPGRDGGRFGRAVLGGWSVAGTYTAESPEFATVQSGVDSNLNGDSAGDRVIVNPAGDPGKGSDVKPLKNSAGATVAYLANDPTARYIRAAAGALATGGRNTLPLAGINNFDLAAVKRIRMREGRSIEFRALLYNAANHPQFTPGSINTVQPVPRPATRVNLIPGNPSFGKSADVFESNARTITVVAKFIF